jgi:hypothetical protein
MKGIVKKDCRIKYLGKVYLEGDLIEFPDNFGWDDKIEQERKIKIKESKHDE